MAERLAGRVAIVTGASSGIGEAIAVALAREGAHVALAARRLGELERVAAAIAADGGSALAVPCDVKSESDIIALVERTVNTFGRIDILVNNAGMTAHRKIEDISLEYWNDVLAVNLTSAMLASREAIKVMKSQTPQGGRIVSIGSVSQKTPRAESLGYTVTKHGLQGLTHQLTLDGRAYGVVASIVHPGVTFSGFGAQIRKEIQPGPGATPQDYVMYGDDVAGVVVTMCALPPEVNLYEATILPNEQRSFIGRG
jgi:NAD(P)-dependent dehydrogenase (short-subunit alcohol dehydrogenase family)